MANIANYRADTLMYSYKKVKITTADPIAGYIEGRDSADQPIQITFTFFHTPLVQVPKVGEYWLVTRLDNNWVLHSRFEDGNEVKSAKELKGGDVRVSAPSHLLIDAQEIIMDFNKAAPSLANLGTSTLPGSALYGSATLNQINVGTVVVSKTFITPFADFIPSRNVVDGQKCDYMFATTDGRDIGWSFKYHAATVSTYKWHFIGGPPYINFVQGTVSTTGTSWFNQYTNSTGTSTFNYGGTPVLRIPYDGEYIISGGGEAICGNNNIGFQFGLSVNGSIPASTLSGYLSAANTPQSVNTTQRIFLNKNDQLTEVYRKDPNNVGSPADATLSFFNRWIQIIPARVKADPTEDPAPVVDIPYTGAG
jgi:hypothetical protein